MLGRLPKKHVWGVGLGMITGVAAVPWIFGCFDVFIMKKALAKLPAMDVGGLGMIPVVAVVPWVFGRFVSAEKVTGTSASCQERVWLGLGSTHL